MLRILPFLLMFGVGVYAFIDCLTTDEKDVRNLPKLAWVFILLLLWPAVFLGPVAWFIAGRPRRDPTTTNAFGRPRTVHIAPDDNPEFLASLNKNNREHEDLLKEWEEELKRADDELRGDDPDGGDGRKKD
ncbi:PLD nuclease N-terminal domain-containing protein [Yinghuangia sp. ASG 101]|uniref:PLD nuclease N-terminal domain-containing protein n=1 Tax=Yinghuangia sp. ASG 101 TaxID=2896848 RepID=UPI001E5ADFB1|nr:PLD nuclease N-terminal domain-containing protein [Yinghuangia sp. ASG 101]UGQ14733.1 PLD nuclease N-terminal domain-containing protein [Yinghuangia sp. ASG 101]